MTLDHQHLKLALLEATIIKTGMFMSKLSFEPSFFILKSDGMYHPNLESMPIQSGQSGKSGILKQMVAEEVASITKEGGKFKTNANPNSYMPDCVPKR
jgi:hypothetical protein